MAGLDDEDEDRGALTNDEDDALRAKLMLQLKGATVEEEEDTDGLDSPPPAAPDDKAVITAEEGFEAAEKAQRAGPKPAEPADIDAQIDAKPAAVAPAPLALPSEEMLAAPMETLLQGLDDGRRAEVERRLTAGSDLAQVFVGREAELKLHGNLTPAQATERLLQLNSFAQQKPDEYLAWVATQINQAAPQDILAAAAKHLGYKIVPDVDDEDEFEDETFKALKAENKRLKGQPDFGPDAAQNVVADASMRTLRAFWGETDATGALKHPLHQKYSGELSAKVMEYRAANGNRMPTQADLSRFYFEVAPVIVAPAQTSAAKPQEGVKEPNPSAAAATEKAKAASKMLDGSGPGSDRRPALHGDALLRRQLADNFAKSRGEG